MAEPASPSGAEAQALHHPSFLRYRVVWVLLLVLTVLTYTVARFHVPSPFHVIIALLIAVAKGTLVALFFMHLWDQRGASRLVFLTTLVFVALLIGLVIADNATRFQLANPPGSAGALPVDGTMRDQPTDTEQRQEP